MVTDTTLNKFIVTRQHLSFDPQLFPLRLKPTAPPLFRNYHRLISTQAPTSTITPTQPLTSPFEEAEGFDFDPADKSATKTPAPKEIHKRKRTGDESDSSESDSDTVTTSTRSLRPRTPKPDTVKPPTPPSRYDTDEAFRSSARSQKSPRTRSPRSRSLRGRFIPTGSASATMRLKVR
jgi:hypothetical protein